MTLFERDKSIKLRRIDDNSLEVVAHLKDNFHELTTTIVFDCNSRLVRQAEAEMITVPFDLCHEVCAKMHELVGLQIKKGVRKWVREIVGKSWGCTHLVDLVMDSFKVAVQVTDYCLLPPEMPWEEKIQKIQVRNMGICHSYSSLDRKPTYTGRKNL